MHSQFVLLLEQQVLKPDEKLYACLPDHVELYVAARAK